MPGSLESAIEEERKEIMAMLEQQTGHKGHPRSSTHASESKPVLPPPRSSPFSPVRSMVEIDDEDWEPKLPRARMARNSPPSMPIRSMLDLNGVPDPSVLSRSAQSSPTHERHGLKNGERTTSYIPYTKHAQHRSLSDSSSKPAPFGPRSESVGANAGHTFQFTPYHPHVGGSAAPKRNRSTGRRSSGMADTLMGRDLNFFGSGERGRNHSITGTGMSEQKLNSPHPPFDGRSLSPILKTRHATFELDNGTFIDMNTAYQRLSDANLARAGGHLGVLGRRSIQRRLESGEQLPPDDAKLVNGRDIGSDSSDDEERSSDADDDDDKPRGREKKSRADENGDYPEDQKDENGKDSEPHKLLAAAEVESNKAPSTYKVRSLIDPEITITTPSGDRIVRALKSSSGIHPNTSFDEGASGFSTPYNSDTEADFTDIKHAQKLSINMTPIVSTPTTSRCVRTIYRGDFGKMQKEAHESQRRVRKYLVATDLSEEAAHALEWTIGTVLRDGDTLLAIYCVDEKLGIVPNNSSGDDQTLAAQAAAIAAPARSSVSTPVLAATHVPSPSPLGHQFRLDSVSSTSASPTGRDRSQAEHERYRAVQDITERIARLLRKTKLQVKVVIEVIHCKSPEHLIIEVIDHLSPTLVILGSRGRSALKGVMLGSFSNYLVTKSSVPVMVARKRLRKHNKYRRPAIRLANNLANPIPKTLASAKID